MAPSHSRGRRYPDQKVWVWVPFYSLKKRQLTENYWRKIEGQHDRGTLRNRIRPVSDFCLVRIKMPLLTCLSRDSGGFQERWGCLSLFAGNFSELRWPGDSQRESGRFARIDSQKSPYFHNVPAIRANRLKTAIRNFLPLKARFAKKGFRLGTPRRFVRIR